MTDTIDESFIKLAQVGEGTYGYDRFEGPSLIPPNSSKVYKAKCKKTNTLVALKKIRMESEKEGFPVTAAREIKLLKCMEHENIVKLRQICASSAESVYLVFEYFEYDLAGILLHPDRALFTLPHIKYIMKQLLAALDYLHAHGVVHRDIKGSNLLLDTSGRVKLADFGLAKVFIHPDKAAHPAADDNVEPQCNRMMTNRVITLWYRPPELLLGSTSYGPEVDMWGAGCIFLDLLAGKPVFTGQDEISQLECICRRLGPIPSTLEALRNLPWFNMMTDLISAEDDSSPASPRSADYLFDEFGDRLGEGREGLDLLRSLLAMDPAHRISAHDALNHPWFRVEPAACEPSNLRLPQDGEWHEFEGKQRTRK